MLLEFWDIAFLNFPYFLSVLINRTENNTIMEKYLIHSNELHLIRVEKIRQAVENMVKSLDMAAGSTYHFDLYKVVESYFRDLEARRKINHLLDIVNDEEEQEEKIDGF